MSRKLTQAESELLIKNIDTIIEHIKKGKESLMINKDAWIDLRVHDYFEEVN